MACQTQSQPAKRATTTSDQGPTLSLQSPVPVLPINLPVPVSVPAGCTSNQAIPLPVPTSPQNPVSLINQSDPGCPEAAYEDPEINQGELGFWLSHADSLELDTCRHTHLSDVFTDLQFLKGAEKANNFSDEKDIDMLMVNQEDQRWIRRGGQKLSQFLEEYASQRKEDDESGVASPVRNSAPSGNAVNEMLVLFVPSKLESDETTFGNRIDLSREHVNILVKKFGVDPSYLLNSMGRADYWAPRTRVLPGKDGKAETFELSLQHPRWNLQMHGAAISVYMRVDMRPRPRVLYIIAANIHNTSVSALKRLISTVIHNKKDAGGFKTDMFLNDPMCLHTMLCLLTFEASKYHAKHFQRFMWKQFVKVNDHFRKGREIKERGTLDQLTKELQIISYNADSFLANADIARINSDYVKDMHSAVHEVLLGMGSASSGGDGTSKQVKSADDATITRNRNLALADRRGLEILKYVDSSMAKQRIWFVDHKNRKDVTMNMVYNLVTQQDAANNMSIAVDMRKDSGSMNAIAALTMFFLPATFTATLLGAGIFSAVEGTSLGVAVSSLWWFWVIITLPLTICVVIGFAWYQSERMKEIVLRAKQAVGGSRKADSSKSYVPGGDSPSNKKGAVMDMGYDTVLQRALFESEKLSH